MNPANADPVPGLKAFCRPTDAVNPTDHFMTGNHGQSRRCRAAFDLVEFGVTDAAGRHGNANFIRTGHRLRKICLAQGPITGIDQYNPIE